MSIPPDQHVVVVPHCRRTKGPAGAAAAADTTRILESLQVPYMLTGSFAMAFYAKPRMTRDIDLVLAIGAEDVQPLTSALSGDFYVDPDAAREAIAQQRQFNLLHYASGIKIDLIVRKTAPYRHLEFDRRRRARLGDLEICVVSREDLVLSKLEWSKETESELQRADIRQLLDGSLDLDYLRQWAQVLEVDAVLLELMP